jgi:DNA-binding response OmpR family regulator
MRVLLAEDDGRIAASLADTLTKAGFAVDAVGDGEEAWFRGDTEDYDIVVLDLGLPKLDGLTALKRWRASGRTMPVLILTARGNWDERVDGIEAGADDYVVKPFRAEEVVARVRAIIRRSTGIATPRLEVGPFALDTRTMTVSRGGEPISLTPLEYRLLSYLMHNNGRAISQLQITQHLYAQDFERDSNAVEVLVGRLRKKLGNDAIKTRRGFGYYVGESDS